MRGEAAVITMLIQAWQTNCLATRWLFSLRQPGWGGGEAEPGLIASCLHGKVNHFSLSRSTGVAPGTGVWNRRMDKEEEEQQEEEEEGWGWV